MTGQKMSYEERRQKAAQLHVDKWNQRGYLDANGEAYLMATLNEMLEEAETTIAAQAEAIILREWGTIEKYNDWVKNNNPAAIRTKKYLLEHGYIDSKTDEDGER